MAVSSASKHEEGRPCTMLPVEISTRTLTQARHRFTGSGSITLTPLRSGVAVALAHTRTSFFDIESYSLLGNIPQASACRTSSSPQPVKAIVNSVKEAAEDKRDRTSHSMLGFVCASSISFCRAAEYWESWPGQFSSSYLQGFAGPQLTRNSLWHW